jgi:hypothetical protein
MLNSDTAAAGSDDNAADNGNSEPWMVSGNGASADPHAVLLAGAGEFAAAVGPISVPEAGRELLYRLQVRHTEAVLQQAGHALPCSASA